MSHAAATTSSFHAPAGFYVYRPSERNILAPQQQRKQQQQEEALPLVATNTSPSEDNNNKKHGNDDQHAEPEEAPRIAREEQGLCLTCGKQLYKVKKPNKLGLFRKKSFKLVPKSKDSSCKTKDASTPPPAAAPVIQKVPLNIPGEVERGQCLQCCVSATTTAAAPATESDEPLDAAPPGIAEDRGADGAAAGVVRRTPARTSSSASSSTKAVYEGSFNVYGERDGQGTMTWENGDQYKGDFFNGNRHGHGTLTFADGSEYVGEWECNQQHGIGTRRWNNGDIYTGQYSKGKRTGEGRFYFANGDLYTGHWDNGVMHGFGRYYYSSGQRFEGEFEQGLRRGKGKLQRANGSLDIGVYSNDARIGVGVRWSADRTAAWRMLDGKIKKRIPVPEAVALDYDMEAHARQITGDGEDGVVV